jgi:hypothetical protein
MLQPGNVYSQFTEVGLGVGGAVYYGDLTIDKAVDNIKLVRPNVGVFISHHFDDRWAVLAGLQNFTLIADDAFNSRESIRMRNLSFKSNVWEFALRGEFYLIPFYPEKKNYSFTLYASTGVAVFYHNPKAEFLGEYYALHPLSTEGQGLDNVPEVKPYSLIQLSIPVLGGIKYNITPGINFFIEFGPRITFTDYLDDVSRSYTIGNVLQSSKGDIAYYLSDRRIVKDGEVKKYPDLEGRGNPKTKDLYFVGLTGLSFNLDNIIGDMFSKKVKCPTF